MQRKLCLRFDYSKGSGTHSRTQAPVPFLCSNFLPFFRLQWPGFLSQQTKLHAELLKYEYSVTLSTPEPGIIEQASPLYESCHVCVSDEYFTVLN